ncbi:hypothetical protein LCGC14_1661450 [marine sediment metagenome]|uniref:Uncharacterized protein n=1 Tax=marine sediment metagenome TaxID=412755 RepID=A0A0F9HTZ0_9ZZZZ
MIKVSCDLCGLEIKVRSLGELDGIIDMGEEYDLCGSCLEKWSTYMNEVNEHTRSYRKDKVKAFFKESNVIPMS